jgi:hypothetical protein
MGFVFILAGAVAVAASLTLYGAALPAFVFLLVAAFGSITIVINERDDRSSFIPAAFALPLAVLLSSYVVAAALGIPVQAVNSHPIWLFFLVSLVALIRVLMHLWDIIYQSHMMAQWYQSRISQHVTEGALFASLIQSAYLAADDYEDSDIIDSIRNSSGYAAALHRRPNRRLTDQARHALRGRGDKIATTILQPATLLVTPGFSREKVARSLLNGAMSIYRADWDNLAQVEPDITFKSALRRHAPRIVTAALIAGAAFVLTAVNGLIPPDRVGYVRTTLLVAAFFALLVPDTSKLRDTALGIAKDAMGKPGKD